MYALEINDLTKVYATGLTALKGISIQVEQGDFFALLGPNGAGKSTTIGIIASMYSAIFVTRSLVDLIYTNRPDKKLSIGI